MVERDSIYGSGFAYPFMWDEQKGGAAEASGKDSVVASLVRLFDTAPGEEFMRPEYGCPLKLLVFEQDTEVFRALVTTVIREAVERWEPRVEEVTSVEIEEGAEPNTIHLRVTFQLIKDAGLYNFVYPLSVPD